MSKTRIYAITPTDATATPEPHLVEANSPGQALKHVTRSMFKVAVASGKNVADAYKAGLEVEIAGEESHDPELPESEQQQVDPPAPASKPPLNPAAAWPFPKGDRPGKSAVVSDGASA